jgi:hypothetical protein
MTDTTTSSSKTCSREQWNGVDDAVRQDNARLLQRQQIAREQRHLGCWNVGSAVESG